jgi:dienelactone hydrolase/predicted negative regulator of RcsB-dependent stress response
MYVRSLFVLIWIASTTAWAENGPLFHFEERPGPYRVGLKVVEQYDYSRAYRHATDELGKPYRGERARPVQTLVWYPADPVNAKPMTVGNYRDLWATETSFGHPKMPARSKKRYSGMGPTLAMRLRALRDAPLAPGRFPVVIYAPGLSGVSWENADLCEYLASHGYVVIASASFGATSRNMNVERIEAEAQGRDISFLVGYAQTLPNTDMSEVAAVGFSWGGIASLFAAARDSRIDALIALDGSTRYYPGIVKEASDVHPEQMTVPLLFFTQGEITLEFQDRNFRDALTHDPNVLNAWTHGDLLTVHMLGLSHGEFTSMIQRDEYLWNDLSEFTKAGYGRADAITGYAWVARYAREFLDAYLKHDATAITYLKRTPADNGAPEHFMTVEFRDAVGVPASFDGFRTEIGRQGFDHAADIYAAFRKDKPDFRLDQVAVDSWADELITDDHLSEAILLLELNVQMHSDSSFVHESLGDAYRMAGKKQLAIDSYNKALQSDPRGRSVERKLAELEVR